MARRVYEIGPPTPSDIVDALKRTMNLIAQNRSLNPDYRVSYGEREYEEMAEALHGSTLDTMIDWINWSYLKFNEMRPSSIREWLSRG